MRKESAPIENEQNYDWAYRRLILAAEQDDSEKMKQYIGIMLRHVGAKLPED